MKKTANKILFSLFFSALAAGTACAGEWRQDSIGWWYDNGDGSYQQNGWFQDADGKYYYFNESGYMLANTTTLDGYQVGADGSWTADSEQAEETTAETAVEEKAAEIPSLADLGDRSYFFNWHDVKTEVNGDTWIITGTFSASWPIGFYSGTYSVHVSDETIYDVEYFIGTGIEETMDCMKVSKDVFVAEYLIGGKNEFLMISVKDGKVESVGSSVFEPQL